MPSLPFPFLERLKHILPIETQNDVLRTFSRPGPLSVRINTLKIGREELTKELVEHKIFFTPVPWYKDALILNDIPQKELGETEFAQQKFFYSQSLSSMLPVIVLDPQPGEKILDMCAAPGGKTTQMASHMNNEGSILAVEAIKDRFYRLKSVVNQLGASIVDYKVMDARRFRFQGEYFDRILVDVPCSSEGRFKTSAPKSFAYWSPRKIREMAQKQRGILMTASHLLKPGGVLVYSTCTFAPEENEGVVDWLLKKTKGTIQVVPIDLPDVKTYPALRVWQNKEFNPEVSKCLRVLPNEMMEGFFIAKLAKC